MRIFATDAHVAWHVSLTVKRLRPAKTAERIGILFGVESLESQRNTVCGGVYGANNCD